MNKINFSYASKSEHNFAQRLIIKTIESLDMIDGGDLEIISLHTREALKNIDSITTETDNEEVLGIIFSKFCIGK